MAPKAVVNRGRTLSAKCGRVQRTDSLLTRSVRVEPKWRLADRHILLRWCLLIQVFSSVTSREVACVTSRVLSASMYVGMYVYVFPLDVCVCMPGYLRIGVHISIGVYV